MNDRKPLQFRLNTALLKRFQTLAARSIFCALLFGFTTFVRADDEKSTKRFTEAIIALAPGVDPAEAEAISVTAHTTARRLAREYRVVGPAVFQNFLIHIGAREKGYCFHWARDIGTQLKEIRPRSLDLHWGSAETGTVGEHNCIVVVAHGQGFYTGYLIDGWRNAGRLCWWPVAKDSSYHWHEDPRETAWLNDYGPPPKPPEMTAALIRHVPKPDSRKAEAKKAAVLPGKGEPKVEIVSSPKT